MECWQSESASKNVLRMVRSYRKWTGRDLLPDGAESNWARSAWEAPFVLVAHGTQADPVLCYGNATALRLWEMSWEELTSTPSRYTAEAPLREERARLLAEVTSNGFIANYAGIRIAKTGRRFRIRQATVWNVLDEANQPAGQAATFSEWEWL
jgi:hypothetical protein